MNPGTRRLLLFGLLLLAVVLVSRRDADGINDPWRSKTDAIRLLRGKSVAWPSRIVDILLPVMPDRLINHLSLQSPRTVTAYIGHAPSNPLHPRDFRAEFYMVSAATGGSFVAMTTNAYRGPIVVWDTLMPPSLMFPELTFVNVDGDSTYELICSGQILDSQLREWAIIDWDSTGGQLLAPRLDQSGSDIWANRLIGQSLRLRDDSTSAHKEIEIIGALPTGVAPQKADSTALGIRVFRYNDTIGGYLPEQ